MFAIAAYTLAFTVAQAVEVRIAPDQPAPLFFTDEPLVVQVYSDASTTAAPEIDAVLPDGRNATWSPGALALVARRTKWLTMEGLPVLRGPHVFRVRVGPDGPTDERALVRIDRPTSSGANAAVFAMDTPSPAARYAAQCIGAGIQLPLEWHELGSEITAFLQPGCGPLQVRITAHGGRHPRTVEAAVSSLRGRVDLWTLGGALSPREALRQAMVIHGEDADAAWGVRLAGGRDAAGILHRAAEHPPRAIVCPPDAAGALVDVAARAGVERMPLLVEIPDAVAASPENLVGALAEHGLGAGRSALVPQRAIESPGGFSGALAVLSSLRTHLSGADLLGRITEPGANEAWIFRLAPRSNPETWAIVAVARDAAAPFPVIDPGEGATWSVLDAYGNLLSSARLPGEPIALSSSGAAAWIAPGTGGRLLREALSARVRALAASHVEHTGELAAVVPETVATVEALANYELPAPVRLHFFALLRSLPALEEGWRRGVIETRFAIPLIRDFAVMSENLAVLEQELDESLLEPLDKTLDTCAEWLARFPESADAAPLSIHRLEFLRGEVARLVDKARGLAAAGRPIEAKAVAALAEWRARSLEPAATIAWPEPESADTAEEIPAPPSEDDAPADDKEIPE